MRQRSPPENASETQETEKALFFVVKRVREAILDEVFQPGDRLVEVDLAEKFEVSRQPVREALLALEKEGTVIMSPYKGAMVKPLSVLNFLMRLLLGLETQIRGSEPPGRRAKDWQSSSRIVEPCSFWMVWSRSKIRLVHKKDGYVSLPSRPFSASSQPSIRESTCYRRPYRGSRQIKKSKTALGGRST